MKTILHKMVKIEHNIQEMRSENHSQLSVNQSMNSSRNNKGLASQSYFINNESKMTDIKLSPNLKKQNNSNWSNYNLFIDNSSRSFKENEEYKHFPNVKKNNLVNDDIFTNGNMVKLSDKQLPPIHPLITPNNLAEINNDSDVKSSDGDGSIIIIDNKSE